MPRIVENDGDEDADDQVQTNEEHVELEQEPQARAEPEIEVLEEGDEPQGDQRIAQSDDDEPQQSRRRETAAERRQRAKEAKIRDKRELDFQKRELDRLQRTVHELTQGQVVTRLTELDNRLASAQAEVSQWEKVKAMAISKHEGADAVAADNFLNAARDKANQAIWEKQQVTEQARQVQQVPVRQEVPFQGLMQEFLDANEWYDPKGVDEDSLIVKAIDNAVAQKYKPTDPAYWRELQKRVDARFGQERQQSRNDDSDEDDVDEPVVRRRSPPVSGSSRSNSAASGGQQQIRLSPERVQAMKDAGLWDDPKVRQRMAKKYSEYDRNNPQRRA
jgi:hypothetical protein